MRRNLFGHEVISIGVEELLINNTRDRFLAAALRDCCYWQQLLQFYCSSSIELATFRMAQ
jgi:hypothetical protein